MVTPGRSSPLIQLPATGCAPTPRALGEADPSAPRSHLRMCEKFRSWFDTLTTNGMVSIEIQELSRSSRLSKGGRLFFHTL